MSLLAVGAAHYAKGTIIEKSCWLRPIKNIKHLNMVELNDEVRGINHMLKWQVTILHVNTDSICMYHWVTNGLTGNSWLNTKAASEMLIKWWLETPTSLLKEYNILVDIALVRSDQNQADLLTRVPQKWFNDMKEVKPIQPMCALIVGNLSPALLTEIHWYREHLEVKWTLYFMCRINPFVSKAAVRSSFRVVIAASQ